MLSLGILLKADAKVAKEELEAFAKKVEALADGLGGDFDSLSSIIKSKMLSTFPVFGLVAGGIAAVGGALYEMAERAGEAGDKIYLASKAMGVSTDTVQGLQLAAKEADVSFEAVRRGIAHLVLETSELATPGSQAAKALQMLGISTRDADGHLKEAGALLPEIMTKLSGLKDGAEKTAIASALLGAKVGSQLIPMLDLGGDAFNKLVKRATDYSGITSEVALKDHEFAESLIELKAKLGGAFNRIAQLAIPVMTGLLNEIERQIIAWQTFGLWIDKVFYQFDRLGLKMQGSALGIAQDTQKIDELNKAIAETIERRKHLGEEEGAEKKFEEGLARAAGQSAEKLDDLRKAAEGAYEVSKHKMTPAVIEAIKAYREAAAVQKQLTDALEMTAEKEAELTEKHKKEAEALLRATMDAHGYTEQLELMNKAMEANSKIIDKRMQVFHESLGQMKEVLDMQSGKTEDPGTLPGMPSKENLGDMLAVFKSAPPTVINPFTESIKGLSTAFSQMSDHFGRAAPMMNTFSQALQRVGERNRETTTFAEAFLNVQKKQGQTALEAGTSMAASYGMEAAAFIKNKRAQAIVMAVMETAKGLSEVLTDPAAAALDFASAAMYGVVAGMSGGGGGGGKSAANTGGGAGPGSGGSQGVAGGGGLLSSGGSGSGNYHQTMVNIYGGQLVGTNELQGLVSTLNQGGANGVIRMNVGGTSATIPTPAY